LSQSHDQTQHGAGPAAPQAGGVDPLAIRVMAVGAVAKYHGVLLDPDALHLAPGLAPTSKELLAWARAGGLPGKAARLNWRRLMKLPNTGPVVLLLAGGGAALMMRADRPRNVVWLRDPAVPRDQDGVPVDELRLRQVWSGDVLLIDPPPEAPRQSQLGLGFLFRLVMEEPSLMRDVLIASLVLSFLALLPAMTIMVVFSKVMTYHSTATLGMISALLGLATVWETLLGYARRRVMNTVGTRVDTKLNTMVFSRVLGLPLDFFERRQTGAILYQINQVQKIRDFLTGKMLATLLDLVTVLVMLPVLFYLDATMTWMIIALAGLCGAVILAFLGPVRRAFGRWQMAEIKRSTVMLETVHGIRTVKSLSMERQQREVFDRVTAESADAKEKLGYISNWPDTLATVIEAMMTRGVLMVGALMALMEGRGNLGVLLAFMMLGGRLANPLANVARLIDDIEEVRGAIMIASDVVDNRQEVAAPSLGSRPEINGAIRFDKVDFSYPGTRVLALEGVSFFIPAGSSVGLVGRSGSGKSTVTRLLQSFATGYEGAIDIDGHEIRGMNLEYLRSQFGVVLQDNFLFRGSIRDNIIAGRPGLTLADAVAAARLARAEEFIERMPDGYETIVEEGSPNLSGGQKQRLAIARALIHDPRILILDEATSALDPESEALVNANIARIAEGRTMVVVSHRLSSLTEMDQTIVLDRGRVMDVGPHRDLVERCQVYRQLWLQQIRYMETPRPAAPAPALAQGH
jgi:ABC-type bacteriocin/lantibiotic exporter with double-glycine peptidase domain